MELTYTERAVKDLMRLREFIHSKNPRAAQKISHQLLQNIQTLVNQPKMGKPIDRLKGFRELVSGDYIVRYRLIEREIIILNIWHAKEER